MEISDLNLQLCIDKLNERNARFAARTGTTVPLADTQEVTVEFGPYSTARDVPQLREFLRHFTWYTNALAAPTVAKSFVEGDAPERVAFTVEGQDFYGRWRQAVISERREERRPGETEFYIALTLRKGFLQAYALSEVKRLGVDFSVPGGGPSVFVAQDDSTDNAFEAVLYGCDPEKVSTIYAGFPASYTNPTIEGEALTGKWVKSHGQQRPEEDGSWTARAVYVKVTTVTNFASLPTPVISYARDRRDPWGNTLDQDDVVYTYYSIDPASLATVAALASSDFASNAPAGHTFIKRRIVRNACGAYNMEAAWRKVSTTSITTIASLSGLTPYATQDDEILNLFGFETGRGESLAFVYANLSPASRSACDAFTDAALVTALVESLLTAWVDATATFALGDLRTDTGVDYICILGYSYTAGGSAPSADATHWAVWGDWSYAKRLFEGREDGTARFSVAFRRQTWDKAWTDKREMGRANTDGWKLQSVEQVSGVPVSSRSTLLDAMAVSEIDATDDENDYAVDDIIIEERQGFLAASKRKVRVYDGVEDGDAVIVEIMPPINGDGRALVRTWFMRNLTAKTALIAASGKAVSTYSYTFPGDGTDATTLRPKRVVVTDYGNGAYDVTQYLVDAGDSSAAVHETFFESIQSVKMVETRSKDDMIKVKTYTEWVCMKPTRKEAWEYCHDTSNLVNKYANHVIIRGSTRVTSIGPWKYEAYRLTQNPATMIDAWV